MSYVKGYMREALKDHVLERIDMPGAVALFKLHDPTCRTYSVVIAASQRGIVITSDLNLDGRPELYAYVNGGRALDWFTSALSETDLCRRFLKKRWQPEAAAQWCADRMRAILSGREAGDLDGLTDIRRRLEAHEIVDEEYFSRELAGIGMAQRETPGQGFPPLDAGWLVAVHERFVELYLAEVKTC